MYTELTTDDYNEHKKIAIPLLIEHSQHHSFGYYPY